MVMNLLLLSLIAQFDETFRKSARIRTRISKKRRSRRRILIIIIIIVMKKMSRRRRS